MYIAPPQPGMTFQLHTCILYPFGFFDLLHVDVFFHLYDLVYQFLSIQNSRVYSYIHFSLRCLFSYINFNSLSFSSSRSSLFFFLSLPIVNLLTTDVKVPTTYPHHCTSFTIANLIFIIVII